MKKIVAACMTAVLLLLLMACAKNGSSASPGNLAPTPHIPHTSTGEKDVSGEYTDFLCTYPWLETDSMHCYCLQEDGRYQLMNNNRLTDQIGQGSWKLTRDEQNSLTLYLTDGDSGAAVTMYELELYDASIYAFGADGSGYIWLMVRNE